MRVTRKLRYLLLAGTCGWLSGCTRRVDLTPQEFTRLLKDDPELTTLRVYPDRQLLSYYPQVGAGMTRDVTRRKVVERGEHEVQRYRVIRSTSGLIVGTDTLNGMTRFWVNFFTECKDVSCAYGFVQTEHSRYSLVSVPEREGFGAPTSYRRNYLKRNRLRPARLRSLAEVNEVLAVPRRSNKARPIDLQFRKDSWRRVKKTWKKADGV